MTMKKKAIIITAIAAAALAAAAVAEWHWYHQPVIREDDITTTAADTSRTVPTVSEKTVVPTVTESISAVSQPTTIKSISAPAELKKQLASVGGNPEELERSGCRQLISVVAAGSEAKISFYDLQDNVWTRNTSLSCDGCVGSNGVAEGRTEGSKTTPKGLFTIGEAFYINEPPQTGLDSFQITQDTYWVDDPDSQYYNQRVEGSDNADWRSAEHMIDYRPSYDYGCVIGYNTKREYNKGSAMFFHIGSSPTSGCVAVSEEYVLRYLAELNKAKRPYILITTERQG